MASPRFAAQEVSAALGGEVEFLGRGTFGDTWRHGNTAVKIICLDDYPVERLEREVAGLNRVSSPYIVKLLKTHVVDLGGRNRPALTFEYIDGGDVERRIKMGAWPRVSELTDLLHGLLVGVGELHATGTIHRDIKPGNIALRDGIWAEPVLLDLGLARNVEESTITIYPGLVGTARYMSPEQLRGRRARKAADLFAVGVTIRELLGRRHPFYLDNTSYTIDDAVACINAGPSALPGTVPAWLTELLDRLVSPAEHERGSASSSLRRLAAGEGGAGE